MSVLAYACLAWKVQSGRRPWDMPNNKINMYVPVGLGMVTLPI